MVTNHDAQGDTQFSTRTLPWTKLGAVIDEPVTAAEAAKLGGIDFAVSEQPLYYSVVKRDGAPPKFTKIDGRKAIIREDTGQWLSVVSESYPIVQYADAFDFMDGVSAKFVAAGALRGGRQGFMVVQLPDNVTPFEDDPHTLYAVLRTSHDCSRAIEVAVMPLRGRCMNQMTLRSLTKGVQHRWTVIHSGDVKGKMLAAKETFARAREYAGTYVDTAQRLFAIHVSDEIATSTLKAVLPDRPTRPQVIERIVGNWHSRSETVGFDGTGWGLVNAVSEYFDHDRTGGSAESRFLAAMQGQTHNAINKTAGRILTRA